MSRYVMGIDVGGTNLRCAVIDGSNDIVDRQSVRSHADQGMDVLLSNLLSLINDVRKSHDLSAVGIGIPGIIDSSSGVVTAAPNIANVKDYPLRRVLSDRLGGGVEIVIENDANAIAVGEWWKGAGKSVDSLVLLAIGTGLGGGIILGGELWNGADGMAGEIGHTTVYPDGVLCNCGNYGCLETCASSVAIRRMVSDGLKDENIVTSLRGLTTQAHKEEIPYIAMKAAEGGDKFALAIWVSMGRALGIAVASLVNMLNMEMVVIGGGVSNAWDLFIDSLKTEARKRAFPAPMSRLEIKKIILGDDAGILGTAYLARKKLNELKS